MDTRPILPTDHRNHLSATLARILDDNGVPTATKRNVLMEFVADLDAWAGPDWFTLLYTGWRNADRGRVREDLLTVRNRVGPMRLVVGYNPEKREPTGGDQHAYEWGMEAPGVLVETHPAPWHIPELIRSAGPYRNGFMAGLVVACGGNFGVLAHLHTESRGAAGTAAFAHHLGMRVWRKPAL